jgi:hypothetical protein
VIFVPEIEEVSYDKDRRGVPSNGFEKGHYTSLPDEAGGAIGSTQVKIGEEVDLFSGGGEHA